MELLYLLLFATFFVPLLCGMNWLFAQFGWASLASRYQTTRSAPADTYNFCWGSINFFINYKGILRIGFLPEGLYLAVWPLFQIGHPPLLIPWKDITVIEEGFFARVAIGKPRIVTVWLSSKMVKKIQKRK